MNDTLNKIERFFEDDLKIKRILHSTVPNEITDSYDELSRREYSDRLYKAIQDIEYYVTDIIKLELFLLSKEDIIRLKLLFHEMNKKLINCGNDFKKLKQFYQKNISEMKESFVDLVGKNFVGYTLFDSMGDVLKEVNTLNELLHCFHSALGNNEQIYESMQKLREKKNFNEESIKLYGKENDLAIDLYDKFPVDLFCGEVNILSLNNNQKILMMIRDRGHALTIEINFDDKDALISYFIPKICNADMINQLPGVHRVTNDSPFTTGLFRSDLEHLSSKVIHFIECVPSEADMVIEDEKFSK